MKKAKNKSELSERYVAQIVRRMMIQKVKPCGKVYSRKSKTSHD